MVHEDQPSLPGMDPGFLVRVYRISAVVAVVGGVALMLYKSRDWGLGFLLVGMWGVANLWAMEKLMRAALRPSGRNPLTILLAAVIKIPLLYGLGAFLAIKGGFPVLSMICGFSIPLVVVVLKAGGILLAPKVALPDREVKNLHRD